MALNLMHLMALTFAISFNLPLTVSVFFLYLFMLNLNQAYAYLKSLRVFIHFIIVFFVDAARVANNVSYIKIIKIIIIPGQFIQRRKWWFGPPYQGRIDIFNDDGRE